MANTKTTDENVRTVDGTEFVRLATAGNNWKASLSNIFAGLGLVVGTSTITSGTTTHALYDNAGVLGEAANFTIVSGNPNVTAGNYYSVDGTFFGSQDTSNNIFMGAGSGNFGTASGSSNVTIGVRAGGGLTSGGGHICIGTDSGGSLTTNTGGCVYIGTAAGNLTSGDGNFGLGNNAANNLGAGLNNVAIGNNALVGNGTTLSQTVAIGTFALVSAQAGNQTAVGYTAGASVTTGLQNTFYGFLSGSGISTGNYNTICGVTFPNLAAGLSNNVILSDGQGNIVFQYDPTNSIYIQNTATFFLRAKTTLTNNAAASLGTLTNAPAAGNPTKWFAIDDNGTTRYIPSW